MHRGRRAAATAGLWLVPAAGLRRVPLTHAGGAAGVSAAAACKSCVTPARPLPPPLQPMLPPSASLCRRQQRRRPPPRHRLSSSKPRPPPSGAPLRFVLPSVPCMAHTHHAQHTHLPTDRLLLAAAHVPLHSPCVCRSSSHHCDCLCVHACTVHVCVCVAPSPVAAPLDAACTLPHARTPRAPPCAAARFSITIMIVLVPAVLHRHIPPAGTGPSLLTFATSPKLVPHPHSAPLMRAAFPSRQRQQNTERG